MLSLRAHLLVVDDEWALRSLLDRSLYHQFPSCTVTLCAGGTEALRWYDSFGADLLLVDAIMPGLSGYELVQQLRARGDEVPIGLMVSATGRRGSCLAGADALLAKPFTTSALVWVVRNLLNRRLPDPAGDETYHAPHTGRRQCTSYCAICWCGMDSHRSSLGDD